MNQEKIVAKYTCGFLFDLYGDFVVLINKKRPDWQAGKYNGVGGKIEDGETPEQCMRREFLEETSVDIENWEHFATLADMRGYRVAFFCAYSEKITDVKTMTDEFVGRFSVHGLPKTIPNLKWLIPMALSIKDDSADMFEVIEWHSRGITK